MSQIRFNTSNAQFFLALKQKTDQYFKERNIGMTGNYKLYTKTAILITTFIAIYITLLFFTPASTVLALILCGLLGVNFAAIGFNVMHDGAHGSYSNNSFVNSCMGYTLNIMGANVYLWKQKHNVNHHNFTNVEGMDDDIDIKPFIRIHKDQPRFYIHRFQHYYSIFLYGLTLFFWVYMRDFKKYFTGKIAANTKMKKMDVPDHFTFWISKVVHISLFLVIPMLTVGVIDTIIGYSVMAYVCGVVLSIVFQLAHVVEETEFINPVEKVTNVQDEWAIHQVNTTVNFATKSKSVNWLLGGLNFQVEHHLFPRISHVHYPALNKIVKETCVEFNVYYKEFPTVLTALRSHLVHLKATGRA